MIAHQWSRGPCGMDQLTEKERQKIQRQMEEFRQELAEQYGIDLIGEEREEIRPQMQEFRQELFEE
jgi:hypothetical protein